ncbi:flagellar glycoprotein-like protein [Leishmania major strain Friedlin]|uniref:Flagellar glycoprotein-like protein n=1 Tax=Leishmania major TaxID=5664 RepID=Q4QHF2_LEIMA|nr:flagellar glycoprotein-like protein [Leishmania major strain Friedlin]CAG9570044.1 Flagellum_adhesion_protein_1 [Leishmania major strain Friedlin]CAJ02699.1 flagellar glycoprotein-like protein [Leishmania major strain Friedlin]|eukprot:XP_001681396.1 flagellar glycoprotein-like protein [Leishmania major strain Friedlin]
MSQCAAVTTRRSPVLRARGPSPHPLVATALVALCIWLQHTAPAAAQSDSDYYDGTYYYHVIFRSAPGGGDSVDGPSGVGVYGVVGYGGAMVGGGVVFSDMGGSGSAIRQISNAGYLSTVAGNLRKKGIQDGPSAEALFGGIPTGDSRANSLAYGNGGFYVADTLNDALRFVNATTNVTTTILNADTLNTPNSLAVSIISDKTSVFISNTGYHSVLYIPSLGSPVGEVNFTSNPYFVPGAITVLPHLSRAFIMNATLQMYCWSYIQPGSQSWKVSTPLAVDFGRILQGSEDGNQVLYVTTNGSTIASLDATASPATSPSLVPQKVIDLDTLLIGGKIQLFFQRTSDSWYILTTTQFLIVSATPIHPDESSSSGSSSEGILSGRHKGIAAFPTAAFPTNDSCLMTQVYNWMRIDATEAYNTDDFLNEFVVPPTDFATLVGGDVNVSAWCGNITTDRSNDGTILILIFWGPRGHDPLYTQDRLAKSPWKGTQAFLKSLNSSGWNLAPFCFYNCTTGCKTITAPKCSAYNIGSACDDVCKGAIASSVVIAAAGVVLLLLMIVSPSNIFTAVVMVPII